MHAPARDRRSRRFRRAPALLSSLLLATAAAAASVAGPAALLSGFSSRIATHCGARCAIAELSGTVNDCCCDVETVDAATTAFFNPVLQSLVKQPFFRYFKVNLQRECPFWHEDGHCVIRDCAVEECAADEVPPPWRASDEANGSSSSSSAENEAGSSSPDSAYSSSCADAHAVHAPRPAEPLMSRVLAGDSGGGLGFLPAVTDEADFTFEAWTESGGEEVWIDQDDTEDDMAYVNLVDNPEQFTGYAGDSAHRIWDAIYDENCFEETDSRGHEACLEKRVFYRLISGMQASISTHLAHKYLDLPEDPHEAPPPLYALPRALYRAARAVGARPRQQRDVFTPHVGQFVARVGTHPERMQNMYFAYLFVLRAIAKAGLALLEYDYDTGNIVADADTRALVARLVAADTPECPAGPAGLLAARAPKALPIRALETCRAGFDESAMFQIPPTAAAAGGGGDLEAYLERANAVALRGEFMRRFQNISRIMDCVGCERCRLWGKVQVLGIGTAIKILLKPDGEMLGDLQRNEIVSLVNTLAQIAASLTAVGDFRRRELRENVQRLAALAAVAVAAAWGLVRWLRRARDGGVKRAVTAGS